MLVGVVVMVFLQSWRAMIIPLIAVPVAIVGTFAVMLMLGFSLNNISLFGLVLAIGIVVDDAIVVVENVERWLEQGLDSREATRRAMDEVTGPVIAVALVLCAVFVPCAFISGIVGQFFRQFAVTIAVSTVFSAINSLTLSPALARILLRSKHGNASHGRRSWLRWLHPETLLSPFFRLFNILFGASTTAYAWIVGLMLRISFLVLLTYAGLLVLTFWIFGQAPTGFIPQQDQGRLIVNIQLPDSASLTRTRETVAEVEKLTLARRQEWPTRQRSRDCRSCSRRTVRTLRSMFVVLDPFEDRRDLTDVKIMEDLRKPGRKQSQGRAWSQYTVRPRAGPERCRRVQADGRRSRRISASPHCSNRPML